MQVLLRVLKDFARDLNNLSDTNVSIVKDKDGVVMTTPGKVVKCDYLSPWIAKKVKHGIITARHRVEYINMIGDLLAECIESDENLYIVSEGNLIKVYKLVSTKKLIPYRTINLVPINSWILSKILL